MKPDQFNLALKGTVGFGVVTLVLLMVVSPILGMSPKQTPWEAVIFAMAIGAYLGWMP